LVVLARHRADTKQHCSLLSGRPEPKPFATAEAGLVDNLSFEIVGGSFFREDFIQTHLKNHRDAYLEDFTPGFLPQKLRWLAAIGAGGIVALIVAIFTLPALLPDGLSLGLIYCVITLGLIASWEVQPVDALPFSLADIRVHFRNVLRKTLVVTLNCSLLGGLIGLIAGPLSRIAEQDQGGVWWEVVYVMYALIHTPISELIRGLIYGCLAGLSSDSFTGWSLD